jgi:hypothetical protein
MSAGACCTTGGTGGVIFPIAGSFLLKRIRIWGSSTGLAVGNTIGVNWQPPTNTTYVPNLEITNTSMSTAVPAYLSTSPPKNSTASFWQSPTASVELFKVAAPSGSIIELDIDFIVSDNDVVPSSYSTASTVVSGHMYTVALDGGSNVIRAIGLTQAN